MLLMALHSFSTKVEHFYLAQAIDKGQKKLGFSAPIHLVKLGTLVENVSTENLH